VAAPATLKVAKATPKVTVKLLPGKTAAAGKAKVRVTVKATGIAAVTGKIVVSWGKSSKTVKLTAAKKGKASVALPIAKAGSYKVKVTYQGSTKVAKKAVAAKKLTIK
jgi:4-hydroxy-L-threonine phosphate dehydrogenase PdxA